MSTSIGTLYAPIEADFGPLNQRISQMAPRITARLGKIGTVGAAGLGAITAAATVAGKALYNVGEEFDDAVDTIRVGTGATGRQLKGLTQDFKAVVKDVPADFADAGTAIADLNTRLGLAGKPLRSISKQILELSRITDTDLNENIASITRLFGDWGVETEQQPKRLDALFRVAQATGITVSDLSRQMVQFGSPLRQLGFDFETAASMFARFEREGVNMQSLMPGLKFALKNLSKPTDDLRQKLEKLGVNMKDPSVALRQVFGELERAPSALKANALAFEVFGARAGPDMAAAVREGRFELDELIKVMRDGSETIEGAGKDTMDFAEHWKVFTNRMKIAVEPAASKVFGLIGDSMERVSKIATDPKLTRKQKFTKLIEMLREAAAEGFDKAVKAAEEYGPKIVGAVGQGIAKAWVDANPIGKLFAAAAIIRLVGGRGALLKTGAAVGRIFGSGFTAGASSSIAATGGATGLGVSLRASMTRLARSLGPMAAAVGIGDAVVAAIAGDIRSAAAKGGGAAIGGAIGAIFGGPAGALAGAGIGSLAGGLIEKLFGDDQDADAAKSRMEDLVKSAEGAAQAQAAAISQIAGASNRVKERQQEAAKAARRVRKAEENLLAVRERYGPNSAEAIRAEAELADAKERSATATRKARNAERLHSHQLEAAKVITRDALAENLKLAAEREADVVRLRKKFKAEKAAGVAVDELAKTARRLMRAERQLGEVQDARTKILGQAERQIGRKWVERVKEMTEAELRWGRQGRTTIRDLMRPLRNSMFDTNRTAGVFAKKVPEAFGKVIESSKDFRATTVDLRTAFNRNWRLMPPVQQEASQALVQDLQSKISAVKNIGSPKVRKRLGGQVRRFAEGGLVPALMSPGERLRFPDGSWGVVPGRPEPRDSVFMPVPSGTEVYTWSGQALLDSGASRAEALRKQLPHFKDGGVAKPQVTGATPKGSELSNKALDTLAAVANKALKAARRSAAGDVSGSMAGGIAAITARVLEQFPGLRVTDSGVRTGSYGSDTSLHKIGRAVDLAASPELMLKAAEWIRTHIGRSLTEGIHKPNLSVKFGQAVPPSFWGEWWDKHADHIHLAKRLGGIVRAFQKGGWVKTGYTVFDDLGGGYRGHLQQGDGYAELGTATRDGRATGQGLIAKALGMPGELPDKFPLQVKINGRVKRMLKRDRGYGQGDTYHSIDIYKDSWDEFGLSATSKGDAYIKPADGTDVKSKDSGVSGAILPGVPAGAMGKFGPLPDTVKGCSDELKERRKQLRLLRKQLKEAQRNLNRAKPEDRDRRRRDVKYLEGHIKRIEDRIKALVKKRAAIMGRIRKRAVAKIAAKGEFANWARLISKRQDAYNIAEQAAQRLGALEPAEPTRADLDQQSSAWHTVLDRLRGWRNTTWAAKVAAQAKIPVWQAGIAKIETLKKTNPKAWKKHKHRIQGLRKAIANARQFVGDRGTDMERFDGYGGIQGPVGKLDQTGPHWLSIGGPGALIFDIQNTVRELGLRVAGQASETGSDSELVSMLREQLRLANMRTTVAERQFEVFKGLPFAGIFHKGGVIPGPPTRESLAVVRGQERVLTPEQQLAAGGQQILIVVEDGAVDPNKIRAIAGDETVKVMRRAGATVGRVPGRGGVYGR